MIGELTAAQVEALERVGELTDAFERIVGDAAGAENGELAERRVDHRVDKGRVVAHDELGDDELAQTHGSLQHQPQNPVIALEQLVLAVVAAVRDPEAHEQAEHATRQPRPSAFTKRLVECPQAD